MAGATISSLSSQSSRLLFKLSPSYPKPSPSPIRISPVRLVAGASYRYTTLPDFLSPIRARNRCSIAVLDQEEVPYALTDDPPFEDVKIVEEIKILEDLGGGFGGGEGNGGEGFGGGGGGDDGDDGDDVDGVEGGKGEGEGESGEKKVDEMSMSQKLTLGYAALVGVGGVMGYMKSGSQKSLAAGGGSALLLYYVYTQLPVRPAFASSLGLGLSAALLAVMGSRFKSSGKIFPAGVVSLVSFIMAGGYFHGLLRSSHA